MDYTTQGLWFKVRKFARYTAMYGLPRTIAKTRGQYHMARRYSSLPASTGDSPTATGRVGLIGCGNFAFSVIAYYLHKYERGLLRGVMDVDPHRAASLAES